MGDDHDEKVYNNNLSSPQKQKWNFFLIACCVVASLASFTFGYNIGVINLPAPLVTKFYGDRYFSEYYLKLDQYNAELRSVKSSQDDLLEAHYKGSGTNLTWSEFGNMTNGENSDSYQNITKELSLLEKVKKGLSEGEIQVSKVGTLLWTLTTSMFVVGGTIGALTSKFVAEKFGRKNGIIFHYLFSILGGILCVIAPYINSPECIIASRFFYGIQGGMACGLIPTYLYEVSPSRLRGSTGVIQQLFLTIGILVSQILGFRQILGTEKLWNILLGLPVVTCVLGAGLLFVLFPETPIALLRKNKDSKSAKKALSKLRQSDDVDDELESIQDDLNKDSKSSTSFSIADLFKRPELKWPLITGLVIQVAQQLCGVNAIFFYSGMIFENAGISKENIQYAVGLTGIINVTATIIAVPLIDRAGRKPLLVYPMCFMVIDFIALTCFLVFAESHYLIPYFSIVCIILFIICFAVGLGPIPFIYCAEVFPSEARSTAIAICMFTNWMANLLLTMTFIYINEFLKNYTFLVFFVIVIFAVVFIFIKVPETKGKSPEEILAEMDSKYAIRNEESNKKLMGNTNV